MSVYTQEFLSEASNGGFISIGSSNTLVHTTPANDIDNVWLWLCTLGSGTAEVIIQINNTDFMHLEVQQNIGPVPILQGEPLSGNTPIHVRSYSGDDVAAFGSIERISSSGTPSTKKFTRQFLNESTNGRPILTSTTETLIHTAHATATDLVWLRLAVDQNNTQSAIIRVGSVSLEVDVNKDTGPMSILQGVPFTGNTAIYVDPNSDNIVYAYGGVDRIQ